MRFFFPQVFSLLLAIRQIANVDAFPITSVADGISITANAPYYVELSERAPTKEVPVRKQEGFATWRGYRALPGLFGITLSHADVKQYAIDTYNAIKNKASSSTLLVSVIYVPSHGIAAGTIWTGGDGEFADLARHRAPSFWASLSGEPQELQDWTGTRHKWHAEAVAAVTVEEEFGDSIVDGL